MTLFSSLRASPDECRDERGNPVECHGIASGFALAMTVNYDIINLYAGDRKKRFK